MADPAGVEDVIALDRAMHPWKYSRGSWSPWDEIDRLRRENQRLAQAVVDTQAALREALDKIALIDGRDDGSDA